MKFHCEQWLEYRARHEAWHRIFAWFPHYCPDIKRCVWLEHVWRRGDYTGCYDPYWIWQYQYSRSGHGRL